VLNGNDFFRNEPPKKSCIVKPFAEMYDCRKAGSRHISPVSIFTAIFPLFVDVAGYFRPSFQGKKSRFNRLVSIIVQNIHENGR
jgi:hypothetical protein